MTTREHVNTSWNLLIIKLFWENIGYRKFISKDLGKVEGEIEDYKSMGTLRNVSRNVVPNNLKKKCISLH